MLVNQHHFFLLDDNHVFTRQCDQWFGCLCFGVRRLCFGVGRLCFGVSRLCFGLGALRVTVPPMRIGECGCARRNWAHAANGMHLE